MRHNAAFVLLWAHPFLPLGSGVGHTLHDGMVEDCILEDILPMSENDGPQGEL